jgi:RND family efflux transporter MFP subunit
VKEGDSVRAGALLAQLDSSELRASHAQALARIAEAEAEIRLAEASLARQRSLVEQGIATAQALDQARRDIDTASARRETASAEADLYAAQLAKTRILAPISGTVTARAVDAGERVEPGTLVFHVANLARLRVEGEADEADAGALAVDAAVTITADGYPDAAWRGRVERVADDVTPRRLKPRDPARPTDTRVIVVEVAFAEATPLKLGTTVDLRITPVTAAHAR